jgi:hypothetical protein
MPMLRQLYHRLPPEARFYVSVTSFAIPVYMAVLLEWVARLVLSLNTPKRLVIGLAFLGAAAVTIHVWALLRTVRRSDEFMRVVMGRRILTAALIFVAGLTVWGLLQNIGWLPAFPLGAAYMLFLIVHTGVIPFINADRP